jgi:predicted kinase
MKTPTVIVLVGSPASGKSTYARQALLENPNLVRLNRDDFRMSMFGKFILDKDGEKMLTKIFKDTAIAYLKQGKDVILDSTHCNLKHLEEVAFNYSPYADVEYLTFDVPLSVKMERNSKREYPVPDEVMIRMHKEFEKLKLNFNFSDVKKLEFSVPNKEKPQAIVFDLDDTLSTAYQRGIYQYDKADNDRPIDPTMYILQLLKWDQPDYYHILFVTGRDESGRTAINTWFHHYFQSAYVPTNDKIFMRAKGDMRSSAIVKEEIYLKSIHPNYNVVGWFDDDNAVNERMKLHGVRMYNTNQK